MCVCMHGEMCLGLTHSTEVRTTSMRGNNMLGVTGNRPRWSLLNVALYLCIPRNMTEQHMSRIPLHLIYHSRKRTESSILTLATPTPSPPLMTPLHGTVSLA